jgi:alanine dehydrogenase
VGLSDADYVQAGATHGDPWACEVIVKVEEIQPGEYAKPRRGQVVLGFDQFAANRALLDAALASGATFISYNTVGRQRGESPILAPMSAIAGRLAVQIGAWCLQKQNGGSGVLLSGCEGVPPGKVAILGAGLVGANALHVAHGIGADVTVYARSERKFAPLRKKYPGARFETGEPRLEGVDLVIGGVFTPGSASPKIITRAMLRAMRPGSALVDIGIDQGGIAETSRLTSHSAPIYVEEGVVHYGVANVPAATPRTASLALERAVLPYVRTLAKGGMDADLEAGIAVRDGRRIAR